MKKIWGTLLLIACMLTGVAKADTTLTFTFVGDCTIGSEDRLIHNKKGFYQVAQEQGYAYFFEKVADFFSEDDLTIANFEGVLQNSPFGFANKTYCFRGKPEFAEIMKLGNVELVNLSNNHTNDYALKGRKNTVAALDAAGVASFDNVKPYIYEKDGIRVAFFGVMRPQYQSGKAVLRKQIADLKADGVNAVIFTPHIGQEYDNLHNDWQTDIAHQLIDMGADLYVGHHPHVVQGMEVYKNRHILYSLGNFVFGGNTAIRGNALRCLVARVEMTFADDGTYLGQKLRLYAAHTSGDEKENNFQPYLVTGEEAQAVFELMDADSASSNKPIQEAQGYRDYAYLEAAVGK
ncbi:MAG: CapA family protein [Clostridia bacterium]